MKKTTLNDALSRATKNTKARKTGATTSSTREGKRLIAGHFDPVTSKQLKRIALDEDTSVQALLREALNDLFEKRGKKRIA
ncbi:MAG: hypothetical protein GXP14_04550 [Gammaproteobacteria bacterium]|nr:hypothetical protein [Gammaproteobacteria bacterium]